MHEAWPPFTSCHRADRWIPSGLFGTSPFSIRAAVRWARWHGKAPCPSRPLTSPPTCPLVQQPPPPCPPPGPSYPQSVQELGPRSDLPARKSSFSPSMRLDATASASNFPLHKVPTLGWTVLKYTKSLKQSAQTEKSNKQKHNDTLKCKWIPYIVSKSRIQSTQGCFTFDFGHTAGKRLILRCTMTSAWTS